MPESIVVTETVVTGTVVGGTVVNGTAKPPVRNRYFYGKLLDERHLSMEQEYLVEHRRRMNRVGHGAGVLCGLEATVTADGRQLVLSPGVAIDGAGREIVVTEPVCIAAPTQPTDPCGRPVGDPVVNGKTTLCLSYLECDIEPTRALVADCETHERCVPGAVRERFRVLVHEGAPDRPAGLTAAQCAAIFPDEPPAGFDRRAAACAALTAACPGPEPDCVTLGTVTAAGAQAAITFQACEGRTTVYSNARLFDLLLCLAERQGGGTPAVERHTLHYVSGDAQNGARDSVLNDPVVVEVRDGAGDPVEGEPVTFRALGGGGEAAVGGGAFALERTIDSDGAGRAEAAWRLGTPGPLFTLEATINGGGRIAFHALAVNDDPPAAPPPKILQIWPPNAAILASGTPERTSFQQRPRIELTFDRDMTQGELENPEKWLRVWRVNRVIGSQRVVPLGLKLITGGWSQESTEAGTTVAWDLAFPEPGWFLVQVRADAHASITDAAEPHALLDADFSGTGTPAAILDSLWDFPTRQHDFSHDLVAEIVSGTGTLEGPASSGDGTPGGRLHAWFQLTNPDDDNAPHH
jgi:hypothetical protein